MSLRHYVMTVSKLTIVSRVKLWGRKVRNYVHARVITSKWKLTTVTWPSGLRRWFQVPVSSGARVRIPPSSDFCFPWSVTFAGVYNVLLVQNIIRDCFSMRILYCSTESLKWLLFKSYMKESSFYQQPITSVLLFDCKTGHEEAYSAAFLSLPETSFPCLGPGGKSDQYPLSSPVPVATQSSLMMLPVYFYFVQLTNFFQEYSCEQVCTTHVL